MATNMDLADKVELDQVITFPNTKSTWNIIERLSPYPEPTPGNYMSVSNSFAHSYVFRVELAGSGQKVVNDAIPKFAIVKMKSSAKTPNDAIDDKLLNEIRVLEQLNLNDSPHAPTILDAKVEHQLTSMRNWTPDPNVQEERNHYVTYVLMTEVTGICLKGDRFWKFDEQERKNIRMAFRTALANVHSNNVTFPTPNPKHLIYKPVTSTLSFVNFETALTFNNLGHTTDVVKPHISRTLPTRHQSWSNTWYADWGLSKDSINPFSTGTDGTVFDDEWKDKYAEVVMREPVMPQEDLRKKLVGVGGSGVEENKERKEYMLQLGVFQRQQDKKCLVM